MDNFTIERYLANRFGLTLAEIAERIDFYDKNRTIKVIDVTDKDKVIIKRNGVVVHKDN